MTITADTESALKGFATGNQEVMERHLETRPESPGASLLKDKKCYALVRIAALVAVDAPPASFIGEVPVALAAEATPGELLGVLVAISHLVGLPKVVAAAPEIALALGLPIDDCAKGEPASSASSI